MAVCYYGIQECSTAHGYFQLISDTIFNMNLHEALHNLDEKQLIKSSVNVLLRDTRPDDRESVLQTFGNEYEQLIGLPRIIRETYKRLSDYDDEELRLINVGVIAAVLVLGDCAQVEKLQQEFPDIT